ncbi:MAG TPA: M1 family aminopeptidase, partial [Pyrinomonadaceae bacterium]
GGAATPPDGSSPPVSRSFAGSNLRGFAVVAGRSLQSAERVAGGVRVRSVFAREHEKTGRRVLDVAARAVEIFAARFGPAPYPLVTVAEAPFAAGVGSAEFTGLCAIASAYYVDFDSAAVRNLPEIVREQRTSVEDSLEFAVAHMIAHQWWGGAVGSDPARQPVLDEALAHWSALVYYREAHGAERAAEASEDQLRGVYEIYRTFGGEDMPADRAAREYRNSFQYAAVVAAKGALALAALEKLLGAERVFKALRGYHEANRFEVAELDDLRAALVAEAALAERRAVTRTLARWLSQRHGDEDISPPNAQLASDLGLSVERGPAAQNPGNRFSRLGKFFWRQMTRIR